MKVFASVLAAIACLFVVPSGAMAVTYTVNSTGDDPDKAVGTGGCETTNAGECTLRAAIQESNASAPVLDEIAFAAAFNGQLADTITPASLLPAITKQVSVKGGVCLTEAGQQGPCAGVNATGLSYALSVEDTDSVVIEGLAITGATAGIKVVNSSQGFIGRGNWVGVKLDGSNGAGANTGIWLDPDSNNATIGGAAASERNVIVNSAAEGLDIEGADNTDVLGNYFGVKPDGFTQAANGKDIEITDTFAFEATGNEVGTAIPTGSLSAPCDAGCNVISGATSYGIDLQGNGGNEEPATGPTAIQGNYIGLSVAGTAVVANSSYGVWSVEAKATTVGGEENGEGNYFAGGGAGIYHGDGEGFAAIGNIFGSGPTGADLTSPGLGIFVYCLNLGTAGADPVEVNQNVFRMEGGIGIESVWGNADIEGNFIEGAGTGIHTLADPSGAGNLITDNVVGNSVTNGILIENDFNLVLHNAIYDSGAAGIRIQDPSGFPILSSTDNQIGGSSAAEENTIRESDGDAIEIVDMFVSGGEESQNSVGRNKGDKNAGLFIDLVDTANEGILPPAFATLQQSSAGGSGVEPFATVRVFRKAEAIPGEIKEFLAETTANIGGKWNVTYPTIPTGTLVAATQTSPEGATSELAIKAASADPESGKDDKNKNKDPEVIGDPPCAFTLGKCRWPETTITRGPKGKTHATTVKFRFTSDMPGSTFECKLDKKPFKKCKSPKKYKGLKPGKHVFKVRATDKQGRVDPVPAKKKFRVLAPK